MNSSQTTSPPTTSSQASVSQATTSKVNMTQTTSQKMSWFRKQHQHWLTKNIPAQDKINLHGKNILIFPSRNGLVFIACAAIVFIAAINYAISLVFGLAFFMVSLFIIAILYGFNNLNQLSLLSQPTAAVFCGEELACKLLISRLPNRQHEALQLSFPNSLICHVDLIKQDQKIVDVFIKTTKRGEFHPPRLKILSYFPLGLARAWCSIDLNFKCLVYPSPEAFDVNALKESHQLADESPKNREGNEEFYGVRDYVPGDSMRQIAWKNVAKGQGLQIKQFLEPVDERFFLDWDMFEGLSVERKLSRLCYAALTLSKSNTVFGLNLPTVSILPATGWDHTHKVLRQLALYHE